MKKLNHVFFLLFVMVLVLLLFLSSDSLYAPALNKTPSLESVANDDGDKIAIILLSMAWARLPQRMTL